MSASPKPRHQRSTCRYCFHPIIKQLIGTEWCTHDWNSWCTRSPNGWHQPKARKK